MVYAQKGNKVCQIDETNIQRYLDNGYSISDSKGTVLYSAVPNDIATLKNAYIAKLSEIASLKSKIAELESNIALLTEQKTSQDEAPKKRSRKADLDKE